MWITSLAPRASATKLPPRLCTQPGTTLKAAKTSYLIEVDGHISLQLHPGPREAAFRVALDLGNDGTDIRVVVIEGDDPFSETAKRSFYQYDRGERRWILHGP